MTPFKPLTPDFSVAPQLSAQDLARAASEGFTLVVNNRPDGEAPDQMPHATAEAAARAAGLAYVHLPISGGPSVDQAEALNAARIGAARTLAYCRSGTRSTLLWSLAEALRGRGSEEIVSDAREAGYDVSGLRPALERLAGL